VNFAMLNRGKRSISIDLKQSGAAQKLRALIADADVLVEQFRPGVMDRLGLGYETVRAINPTIIYCSITGYGQTGPKASVAAHDLNYCAESGMLSLAADKDGAPVVPAALVADIGGGTYPAVMNILLALRRRDRHGVGCRLDIAMADNLFGFMYWAIGGGKGNGVWPRPGGEFLTGGSARYAIYRTADDRFIAAAPLEERFWRIFCDAIGLDPSLRDDAADPGKTKYAIASLIVRRTADDWMRRFDGLDVCCSVVASLPEALADPHFEARGLFARTLTMKKGTVPALCVPVAPELRKRIVDDGFPDLGEANDELLGR
jgi:alpha-methylacyl-CoA racemase